MSEVDVARELGYLAGFFDADGCISAIWERPKKRISPRIVVTNRNQKVLERFHNFFDVGVIHENSNYKYGNRQRCWDWTVFGYGKIRDVLEVLESTLLVKKDQCRLMLQLCRKRVGRYDIPYDKKDFEILAKLKDLNKRGR